MVCNRKLTYSWYAYILVEGMPVQMYGETQFVDYKMCTIIWLNANGARNSVIVESEVINASSATN